MSRLSLKVVLFSISGAILIVGLFIGIYLVSKQTTIKSKAYEQRPSQTAPVDEDYVPALLSTEKLNSEIGIQIDVADNEKIPSRLQFDVLNPGWVRMVYKDRAVGLLNVPSCNPNTPYSRPKAGEPCIPDNVKVLLVYNNESAQGAPIGSKDITVWKTYINNIYLPELQDLLLSRYKFHALEFWNEEDVCPSKQYYCPEVPAEAYAYLLKHAASIVKSSKTSVPVIMGGLNSGKTAYIKEMIKYEPDVFRQVDGVGLHPYGVSPDGSWCKSGGKTSGCVALLTYGENLAKEIDNFKLATGKPIWVTELGFGVNNNAKAESWQGEYLKRAFKVLSDNGVPVIIWYSWTDKMSGGVDDPGFGLLKDNSIVKVSGMQFQLFSGR